MANKWTPFATALLLLILPTGCDLPGQNSHRLVLQLIEANGADQTDPRINDVVEELRNTLRFEGYSLKSEVSIALKPDTVFDQAIGTGNDSPRIVYTFKGGVRATVKAEGREEDQTLQLRVEKGSETVLDTTMGLQPDRTLVLGSLPHTDDAVLLIVVRMIEA